MAKQAQSEAKANTAVEEAAETIPALDSKYRLIIVAAQRSKQLQRGARPRVEMEMQRHKPTRIALEEVLQSKVPFSLTEPVE